MQKDYSESIEPIEFTINDDTFQAVPSLPGNYLRELVKLVKSNGVTDTTKPEEIDGEEALQKLDAVFGFLDKILYPESAVRFAERMGSITEPISFRQAIRVFSDLLKEYTESETEEETEKKAADGQVDESTRPTLAASSSSTGAAITGTSSAAAPPSVDSTSETPTSV